ncbi:MAG: hypothetical protein IJU29_07835 [Oscillospiraceae bacterium]|nr:hypothetical protein [Oscillospiraceae bacterium]
MAYIAMRLYRGVQLTDSAARLLVGYARRRAGRKPWGVLGLDIYSGGGETLLIARPTAAVAVHIADYALPALCKYLPD